MDQHPTPTTPHLPSAMSMWLIVSFPHNLPRATSHETRAPPISIFDEESRVQRVVCLTSRLMATERTRLLACSVMQVTIFMFTFRSSDSASPPIMGGYFTLLDAKTLAYIIIAPFPSFHQLPRKINISPIRTYPNRTRPYRGPDHGAHPRLLMVADIQQGFCTPLVTMRSRF
jgi:hypothetical protein